MSWFSWRRTVGAGAVLLLVGMGFVGGWFTGRWRRDAELRSNLTESIEELTEGNASTPTSKESDADSDGGIDVADLSQSEAYRGTSSSTDGTEVTVTMRLLEIDQNYQDDVQTPEMGRFLAVKVQVENDGPSTLSISSLYFSLEDQDGSAYESSGWHEPSLALRDLQAGQTTAGWLTYDVPDGGDWSFVWLGPGGDTTFARWSLDG